MKKSSARVIYSLAIAFLLTLGIVHFIERSDDVLSLSRSEQLVASALGSRDSEESIGGEESDGQSTMAANKDEVISASARTSGVEHAGYTYTDPARRFSFIYPSRLAVGDPLASGDGETVLFSDESRRNAGVILQLHLTPVEADSYVITESDLASDNPELLILSAEQVAVAPEGSGLSFIAEEGAGGVRTREVWFVWRGWLYQLSVPVAEEKLVRDVLMTWKFL